MSSNPTTTPAVPGVSATLLASLRGKIDKIETIYKDVIAKTTKLLNDPSVSVRMTTDEVKTAKEQTDKAVEVVKEVAIIDLGKVKAEAEKERDEAMRAIKRAVGRPETATATDALLREQRETRAWARLKPILDRVPPQFGPLMDEIKQRVLEALAVADDDGIAVLRAELGHYLQGRGIAQDGAAEAVRQVDQLIGSERPPVAAALALQREIEKGVYSIVLGVNYASNAIQKGTPVFALPEWNGTGARTITRSGVATDVRGMNARSNL